MPWSLPDKCDRNGIVMSATCCCESIQNFCGPVLTAVSMEDGLQVEYFDWCDGYSADPESRQQSSAVQQVVWNSEKYNQEDEHFTEMGNRVAVLPESTIAKSTEANVCSQQWPCAASTQLKLPTRPCCDEQSDNTSSKFVNEPVSPNSYNNCNFEREHTERSTERSCAVPDARSSALSSGHSANTHKPFPRRISSGCSSTASSFGARTRGLKRNILDLQDVELISMAVCDLVQLGTSAGLSNEKIAALKARRRKLKNRFSARGSAQRRRCHYTTLIESHHQLMQECKVLRTCIDELRQANAELSAGIV